MRFPTGAVDWKREAVSTAKVAGVLLLLVVALIPSLNPHGNFKSEFFFASEIFLIFPGCAVAQAIHASPFAALRIPMALAAEFGWLLLLAIPVRLASRAVSWFVSRVRAKIRAS